MWIRSQDERELLDTREFKILDTTIFGFSHLQEKGYEKLGAYCTRNRALEVLDEIQRYIDNFENDKVVSKTKFITEWTPMSPIYEMPKE